MIAPFCSFFPAGLNSLFSFRLPTWIRWIRTENYWTHERSAVIIWGQWAIDCNIWQSYCSCLQATAVSPLHPAGEEGQAALHFSPLAFPLCPLGHQPFLPAEAFHRSINDYFLSKRSEFFFPVVSLVLITLLIIAAHWEDENNHPDHEV